ncbi:unnamed protein product [Closterium sp. NIES-53]
MGSLEPDYSPSLSPASMPPPACCTKVGVPADFSLVIGSPADCSIADGFLVGIPASCSSVGGFYAATFFTGFSIVGCFPYTRCSPVIDGPIFTLTGLTSRRPPAMLLASAIGNTPLLPSSPEADTGVSTSADSGASGGAEPERAEPRGAESGGVEPERAESGGAEPGGAELGGAEPERAEPGGAASGGAGPGAAGSGGVEPAGAGPGDPSGALSRRELPSPQIQTNNIHPSPNLYPYSACPATL